MTEESFRPLKPVEGYRRSTPVRWGNAADRQRQHDVFGEILDREATLAGQFGYSGNVKGWRTEAGETLRPILEEAWDPYLNSLMEHLGGGGLDASLLALPLRRVVPADHPKMAAITGAAELYDSLCSRTNPLGLLPEQIDPTNGAFLGDYPQAFSHIGVISSGFRRRREST